MEPKDDLARDIRAYLQQHGEASVEAITRALGYNLGAVNYTLAEMSDVERVRHPRGGQLWRPKLLNVGSDTMTGNDYVVGQLAQGS